MDLLSKIEQEITQLNFPLSPSNLFDPLRYFLSLGGKRTRPQLAILGCELFDKKGEEALNVALAVELFHNFTLIHDDIMDMAPLRRGKPTVHTKWNNNIAILSGDVLFVKAYEYLSHNKENQLPNLLAVFNQTAKEVCIGQQLDMDFETNSIVSIADYLEMIKLKTSVLLGAALKMGAIVADANANEQNLLYDFGLNIGMAFQLKDDLLDLFGDPEKFGKQIGGDLLNNKKTYLILKALELANNDQRERLNHGMYQLTGSEKISFIKAIFEELDIQKATENKIQSYYDIAIEAISQIKTDNAAKTKLLELASFIKNRVN